VLPIGNNSINYVASDPAGNSTQASFVVTVLDIEAPVISGTPADITTSAGSNCTAVVSWTAPTASDLCSATTLSSDHVPGSTFPLGVTTVVYTATDASGNVATSTFTVTVIDDTAPTIFGVPGTQNLVTREGECTAVATWTEPVAVDACGTPTLTGDHTSGTAFPVGTTTVTYTATDAAGNVSTASFDVVVVDNLGPVVTGAPASQTLEVGAGCAAVATWTEPTFTDGCGVAGVTQSHAPGDSFALGTTTVTYTATDNNGNVTTVTFTITVVDTTGPAFSGVPADILIEISNGLCSSTATWTPPTADDPCGVVVVTSNRNPGDLFQLGDTVVTYTAVDTNGNVSTASFTVTVRDTVPPVFNNLPADFTIPAEPGLCGATATWTAPTGSDNCGVLSLTSDVAPGTFLPLGVTTVTYTVTDLSGNVVTASFNVTVEDTEAPVISGMPANITETLTGGLCTQAVTWAEPTATDNCGGVTLTATALPGDSFPAGSTRVTYTATDDAGNTATATFTVTLIDDTAPVLVNVPADFTVSADPGSCGLIATWAAVTATDNCDTVTPTSDVAPGDFIPVGTTVVTYTATDTSGNSSTASFTVTVTDDEAPTIPNLPTGVTATTSGASCSGVATWDAPIAADNCGVLELTSTHNPSTTFPIGVTTVTYTATDVNGNSASYSFDVTVVDDDAPVITGLPVLLNVQTQPGECGAVVTWPTPTATDNCAVASLTSDYAPGSLFPVGTTVVTYTATDTSGNVGTLSLTINITDGEDPTIVAVPLNITVANDPGACSASVTWTPPVAEDGCPLASFVSTHAPGDLFPIGVTDVTYTATDQSGNTATATFSVTVTDVEAPVITAGGNISVPPTPGECTAVVTVPLASATDNCSVVSLINDFNNTGDASGLYPVGDTVVTWIATDSSGNVSTATQTITVDIAGGEDCDGNGVNDACDIALGNAEDCNENGVPDSCDLVAGTSADVNLNGLPDECELLFVRGDTNNSGLIDLSDPVYLIGTLFNGGPVPVCYDAADFNDDGFMDVSDVVAGIDFVFNGGAAPQPPYPTCGTDPTSDLLDCGTYDHCAP